MDLGVYDDGEDFGSGTELTSCVIDFHGMRLTLNSSVFSPNARRMFNDS
jgi:hypothetical protein